MRKLHILHLFAVLSFGYDYALWMPSQNVSITKLFIQLGRVCKRKIRLSCPRHCTEFFQGGRGSGVAWPRAVGRTDESIPQHAPGGPPRSDANATILLSGGTPGVCNPLDASGPSFDGHYPPPRRPKHGKAFRKVSETVLPKASYKKGSIRMHFSSLKTGVIRIYPKNMGKVELDLTLKNARP